MVVDSYLSPCPRDPCLLNRGGARRTRKRRTRNRDLLRFANNQLRFLWNHLYRFLLHLQALVVDVYSLAHTRSDRVFRSLWNLDFHSRNGRRRPVPPCPLLCA